MSDFTETKLPLVHHTSLRAWSDRIGDTKPFDTIVSIERVEGVENQLHLNVDGKSVWVETDNFVKSVIPFAAEQSQDDRPSYTFTKKCGWMVGTGYYNDFTYTVRAGDPHPMHCNAHDATVQANGEE